jgi:hypothetical protein
MISCIFVERRVNRILIFGIVNTPVTLEAQSLPDRVSGVGSMGFADDGMMQVQARLLDRLDQIECELPHITIARLACEIDEVRRMATAHGMVPLAELAHGLEDSLARSPVAAMAQPFLDTMRDAVGCQKLDYGTAQTYLAAVNQRLYG